MPQRRNNRHASDILTLFFVLILAFLLYVRSEKNNDTPTRSPAAEQVTSPSSSQQPRDEVVSGPFAVPAKQGNEDETAPDIPEAFNIQVPFTSQAPLFVWDALHEEACEEASILMLWHWKNNQQFVSTQSAEEEIQKLVKYEQGRGHRVSISLMDLRTVAADYFPFIGLSVSSIGSVDEIKRLLASGSPVIVGAAGKILPNPNFRNGGPNYHMLVIKGYDKNGFITNDPGTRKGENFYYKYDDLFEAIHDWTDGDIRKGEKRILFYRRD